MSDILGHDIDGRPLRVGDEFEVVSVLEGSKPYLSAGTRGTVTGRFLDGINSDIPDRKYPGETYWFPCSDVRKLHDDHRPATESFSEIIDNLNKVTA